MRYLFIALLALSLSYAADTKLGKPLTLTSQTPIANLNANADRFVGKTVQVKGEVTEVCEMMGCWMKLVDPATKSSIRIKVKDGEIVFPKEAVGKTALAEGKLARIELTKEQAIEQAKHEAEERGQPFDPASIKGPVTYYQIQGIGAVIIN